MTFEKIFTEYIMHKNKTELKFSTISTYFKIYDAQLKNFFGDLNLSDINDSIISQFIVTLFDKQISRKYIKSIVNLLYAILEYAKINYKQYTGLSYIQKANIKTNRTQIEIFNEEEQKKIENHIISNITPINCGILLCLYTGIRIGELCALHVNDFDLIKKQ